MKLSFKAALISGVFWMPWAATSTFGQTLTCTESFATRGVAVPTSASASALDGIPSEGVFFSPGELYLWRQRAVSGPFAHNNDFTHGSPGDWDRIKGRAEAFVVSSEPPAHAADPNANLLRAGFGARDTAFSYLVTGDSRYLNAVRLWLLRETADPKNDVTLLCYRYSDNRTADGYWQHAMWVARVAIAYDFVKGGLSTQDRVSVEHWLRRVGYFMADHIQWGLAYVFPNRRSNNYVTRGSSAAQDVSAPSAWMTVSVDTNGDCTYNSLDSKTTYDVYGYVRPDGKSGPRISALSQWWNNRKSSEVLAFGIIGVMLQDGFLTSEAKRYVAEWLTYSVWPDGIQGEYFRNGDYCVPQQGVVYGTHNTQTALLLADALARKGDRSLYNFETRDGLFGTQSTGTQPAKSIRLAIGAHIGLIDGSIVRYYFEPQRGSAQVPRPATLLNSIAAHSNVSLYHDLSYLPGNRYLDNAWVNTVILRMPGSGTPVFPGSDGMLPDGGPEVWSGVTALFPGSLFMFARDPSKGGDRVWVYGLPLL
jgi:hypothetical protein